MTLLIQYGSNLQANVQQSIIGRWARCWWNCTISTAWHCLQACPLFLGNPCKGNKQPPHPQTHSDHLHCQKVKPIWQSRASKSHLLPLCLQILKGLLLPHQS
jgi:hypothetical protein